MLRDVVSRVKTEIEIERKARLYKIIIENLKKKLY